MTVPLPVRRILPGLALATGVAAAAFGLERAEQAIWGRAWLETLVLAVALGTLLRGLMPLPEGTAPGLRFATKPVMEGAVALMGASVSLKALAGAGLALIGAITAAIALTIVLGYRLGRWLGLSERMAMLVACGNAICGNSAIAAVAPAIEADGEDVAAAIGFTAVMGVVVVLAVAPAAALLRLSPVEGGMLAGMTVYAVPQVLAAASPLGDMAVQVGALVKLARVLMLGPVVTILSLVYGTRGQARAGASAGRFVPGFLVLFVALAALRSWGAIPDPVAVAVRDAALLLTVVAMAGLGLGVNPRGLVGAGPRVTASVILSLAVLFLAALAVIHVMG